RDSVDLASQRGVSNNWRDVGKHRGDIVCLLKGLIKLATGQVPVVAGVTRISRVEKWKKDPFARRHRHSALCGSSPGSGQKPNVSGLVDACIFARWVHGRMVGGWNRKHPLPPGGAPLVVGFPI